MSINSRLSWGLSYLALFAIAFLFFSEATIKGKMLATPGSGGSDITHLNYPSRAYLGETLRKEGHIPLWCPYIFNGFPIHAEGQGGFLYPLNYLLFRFLPAPTAFTWAVVLTFFIAGSGALAFGRLLGLGLLGSLTSGVVFMLSGFFVAHVRHLNMIQAASCFPWLIFFAEKFLRTGRLFFAASAGVVLGLSILAGHPQVVYYMMGAILLYMLLRSLWRDENTTSFKKSLLGFLALILVGLGIGAAQWIPTYELFQNSTRAEGVSHTQAAEWPYFFRDLIIFISPFYMDHPSKGTFPERGDLFYENFFYVGILPLGLACVAILLYLRGRPSLRALVVLAALALGVALSNTVGIDDHLRAILPAFEFFRVHQRALFITGFCVAALSGFGLSFLMERCGMRIGAPLWGILVADLFISGYWENAYVDKSSWFQDPPAVSLIRRKPGRILSMYGDAYGKSFEISSGWARGMNAYTAIREALLPNSNLEWGISAIHGHGTLLTSRHDSLWKLLSENLPREKQKNEIIMTKLGVKLLNLQNMRYLLAFSTIKTSGFVPILESRFSEGLPTFRMYGSLSSLSRAYYVSEFRHARSGEEALGVLQEKGFDPARAVILEGTQGLFSGPQGRWRAEIKEESSRHLKLSVACEKDGFLVLSDTFFPGWRAVMDGQETKIFRANYVFRAVRLPAGSHGVLFQYAPASYRLGCWVSSLTLSIFLTGGICFIRRKSVRGNH